MIKELGGIFRRELEMIKELGGIFCRGLEMIRTSQVYFAGDWK